MGFFFFFFEWAFRNGIIFCHYSFMITPVYLFIYCFLAVHNVVRLGYWMFTARMKWGLTRG